MVSREMLEVIESITDFPLDVPGQRRHYERVWRAVPVDEDIRSEPADLGGIGGARSEWVWTGEQASDACFMYFHGGGYVCGEPWMWRQFNGTLSRASGMRCLAFGYRLAPEYPFPTAVADSFAAYRWLLNSGVSPQEIVLTGDSAGGALVLAVLVELREKGLPLPAGGVVMSPWTDLELRGESMTPATNDPLTTEESAGSMARLYLDDQDPRSPLASVLYADLTELPPVHVEAGTRDVLYSDSARLVEKLTEAGNNVRFHSVPGAIHSYPALAGGTPEAAEAIDRMADFMITITGRASSVPHE
ncbi:alpha/beta hydrolase [Saccharopolyspora phatthalungensis]|uniref:Acetyl esterase/lipase n=1 Tax=Saccharopolyspora phatthalungensis TaxID=664693 RepID=A0A840PYP3_9PSEU|nr:alpha/beta hydrolase [Saccharopolyspora phatthalungensis]MBB5152880.1 acetyl esterase/lipase [Saccharopolyspora phatthalungensis]